MEIEKTQGELVNFPINKLSEWRETLSDYAKKHGDLYAVSDTETTGTQIIEPTSGLFNRVLEWSILFCYKDQDGMLQPCVDKSGSPIIVDEPINPFFERRSNHPKHTKSVNDIPRVTIDVHGITLEYLFGNEEGEKGRPPLPGVAPTFETVFEGVIALLNADVFRNAELVIHIVFHNAPFDIKFLNHECETWSMPYVESFFGVIDTEALAKEVMLKSDAGGFSLDAIYAFGKERYPHLVESVERPVHSAIIDSMILRQVYNILNHHHKLKIEQLD